MINDTPSILCLNLKLLLARIEYAFERPRVWGWPDFRPHRPLDMAVAVREVEAVQVTLERKLGRFVFGDVEGS